jgi:hypothetical protein
MMMLSDDNDVMVVLVRGMDGGVSCSSAEL